MHISPVQNKLYSNISFKRRPSVEEEEDFQNTMDLGFEAAGVKQRIAITHGSVFPAVGRDTFIGSPYGEGAKVWINFLKLNGFTGNQLGPNGALSAGQISPYNSSALNENPLFIDLKALTTDKYGCILSKQTYEAISLPIHRTRESYSFSDFSEAKIIYYEALQESYKNFKKNLAKGQPTAIMIDNEFTIFKDSKKGPQTEEEGIYRVLTSLYGTPDFNKWDKLDSDLMVEIRKNNPEAIARYKELNTKFKQAVEEYQFEQFIVTKQIKENKKFRDSENFKYFSDLLIGCSKMDYWRYKEAFLEGFAMGTMEYDDKPYQTWGIPVLDPRKILLEYNKLNIGGEFLKEKIEHAVENCENLRIDHALGLIDPFIYKEDTVEYDENGRQIKSKVYGNFLSQIKDKDGNELDDYYNYPRILRLIVLPALKEKGIEKEEPVWESIGSQPPLFQKIYHEEEKLPQIIQTEYNRAENGENQHWYLIGSHDSIPVLNMLEEDNGWRRYNPGWDAGYLAHYLNQDPARAKEKEDFYNKISDTENGVEKTAEKLEAADKERVKAKFAELFTKEKIMVSFADILGINDDNIVYNVAGTNNELNWLERIPPDFVDKYYENLSSNNPTALNIPEILKIAVRAKLDMQIAQSSTPDETRKALNAEFQPLLDKLEHYANVLKEKEEFYYYYD